MAFESDLGTCCLVFPLKIGAALICMFHFAQALICTVALLTGDIRFQGNGYNLSTYKLPSIVGTCGLLFGFVGLIGVYGEKVGAVRAFNRFLLVKLAAMLATMVADYAELRKCDSWLQTSEYLNPDGDAFATRNVAMDGLARQNACPWARWAYLIGFAIDFSIAAYFAYKSLAFEKQMELPRPYPIDFGDKAIAARKWLLYGVQDPRMEKRLAASNKQLDAEAEAPSDLESLNKAIAADYGSLATRPTAANATHFGPDGFEARRPRSEASLDQEPRRPWAAPAPGSAAFCAAAGAGAARPMPPVTVVPPQVGNPVYAASAGAVPPATVVPQAGLPPGSERPSDWLPLPQARAVPVAVRLPSQASDRHMLQPP